MQPEIKQGHNRKISKLAAFKFRNSTTFWGIPKCSIGPNNLGGGGGRWGGRGGVSENAQKN